MPALLKVPSPAVYCRRQAGHSRRPARGPTTPNPVVPTLAPGPESTHQSSLEPVLIATPRWIMTDSSSPTGGPLESGYKGLTGKDDGDDIGLLEPRHLGTLDDCDFDNLLQALFGGKLGSWPSPGRAPTRPCGAGASPPPRHQILAASRCLGKQPAACTTISICLLWPAVEFLQSPVCLTVYAAPRPKYCKQQNSI